jgi:hypothetical protein
MLGLERFYLDLTPFVLAEAELRNQCLREVLPFMQPWTGNPRALLTIIFITIVFS